ncbi:MAG: FadR family transcriptional regulator [Anaerolineales bacterium]|nr:FadR family transcriptional regulator [Anaerolineales bacterium]
MPVSLEPVQNQSLQQTCALRMEAKILSGEWIAGQRLHSERTLAQELQVSRPVVHQALVDLAAKGLVCIVPRRGVFVCDYRTSGSLAVLSTLLTYKDQEIDPQLIHDLIEARKLIETETARLAAQKRTTEQLKRIETILDQETTADPGDSRSLTELDFSFHLEIAIASANRVYPMILNSFRSVYTHLTGLFFTTYQGREPVQRTFIAHRNILEKISQQEPEKAAILMADMLDEGAAFLSQIGG